MCVCLRVRAVVQPLQCKGRLNSVAVSRHQHATHLTCWLASEKAFV